MWCNTRHLNRCSILPTFVSFQKVLVPKNKSKRKETLCIETSQVLNLSAKKTIFGRIERDIYGRDEAKVSA